MNNSFLQDVMKNSPDSRIVKTLKFCVISYQLTWILSVLVVDFLENIQKLVEKCPDDII